VLRNAGLQVPISAQSLRGRDQEVIVRKRHIGASLRAGLWPAATVWLGVLVLPAVFAAPAGVGARSGQAQSPPAAGPVPAVHAQPAVPAPPASQPAAAEAGDQSRQQIDSECASLLKLATALKTDVDKTTKDELSVPVVLKAGQIEQLAHKVRDEMTLSAGVK
jgi:hypothetical protein